MLSELIYLILKRYMLNKKSIKLSMNIDKVNCEISYKDSWVPAYGGARWKNKSIKKPRIHYHSYARTKNENRCIKSRIGNHKNNHPYVSKFFDERIVPLVCPENGIALDPCIG